MEHHDAVIDNLIQELRRGSLVLFVLSQMNKKQYGYSLLQDLNSKGLSLEPGTLYPLMRRLEKQGLLESEWDLEGGRPRKYYILSEAGSRTFDRMKEEWQQLAKQMETALDA